MVLVKQTKRFRNRSRGPHDWQMVTRPDRVAVAVCTGCARTYTECVAAGDDQECAMWYKTDTWKAYSRKMVK